MEFKQVVKIGLVAGLVSALFPSIPTIVHFRYYEESWFKWYCILGLGLILVVMLV